MRSCVSFSAASEPEDTHASSEVVEPVGAVLCDGVADEGDEDGARFCLLRAFSTKRSTKGSRRAAQGLAGRVAWSVGR